MRRNSLPFKAAATVFLSQLAKRAADEAWDRRREIVQALRTASVTPLRRLVAAIDQARRASDREPQIIVGLPVPDPYFGTAIHFRPEDEADIAWFVANFVVKAEAIDQTVRDEIGEDLEPMGNVQLHLRDDGSFTVRWLDREDRAWRERLIE